MRKTLFLLMFLSGFSLQAFSQVEELAEKLDVLSEEAKKDTTYWISDFSAGLNFNQAGFSDNWKAGGINSVAFGSIVAGKAFYKKGRLSWDNELELLYGIVKNEGQGTRKSNDRMFFDTKLGYKLTDKWATFFSVNFLSQFSDGFEYETNGSQQLISGFMSPGFLT